ncbi:hypothetical protein AMIS_35300 [Actinoplanes missouriensis 431]|uniref:Uncharacterized protein n=1 Tax=Actinoplanes missouriensis (strain ATCC 14538 / DSM 43046 / CBS 188.64 / JCM 3121 / NBRC 102363 / NCIMB 12654 / NRRL B-3342 / UNCC 431) TaxID=512565 RepID=I0H6W3_ACTM4|nr:DUF6493 family protein [Actinoplanes missouriensis]BAL88750.1 hypothetical protein AMIS_35300 [Actinoplanes missouriensis 431]
MALTWTELDELARRQAHATIAGRLVAMSEAERLASAGDVEAGIKRIRTDDWWDGGLSAAPGYALAVIGCMPSPARAAEVLGRQRMRDIWGDIAVPRFLAVAEARGLTWLPELGARLAGKLPAKEVWAGQWEFVAALLGGSPGLAPRSEGFVRGWLEQVGDSADRFRSSPYTDRLLPAVFEIDSLGGALTSAFPDAVVRLTVDGRVDRAQIVAATVDRLVRGDRPAWLRPFVALHEALGLSDGELAANTGSYARLLAEAPPVIAGLAQRALRAVDEAGRLEVETLLEVSAAVLVRPEKNLVEAQLTWLEKVARREPGRCGEILETVAVAFGHPTLDVQERALTLIGRRRKGVDAGTIARLAESATGLGGDLAGRAATMFGVSAAPAAAAPPGLLAPPAPVAVMPPPIVDGAELAAEVVALIEEETAVGWERVLAGLVAVPAGRRCGRSWSGTPMS